MKSFLQRRESTDKAAEMPPVYKEDAPPPTYLESVPPQLSFTSIADILQPGRVIMKGESRSANFEVKSSDGGLLFAIETESTQVYHETEIKDRRSPGAGTWYLKRKVEGDKYTYSIKAPGMEGKKMLEIQTTSKLLMNSSTRLVFRRQDDTDLDALYLEVGPDGLNAAVKVFYQKQEVGQIKQTASEREPNFQLDIDIAGIDPMLFVVFALVLDDRCMTTRRRLRRSKAAGVDGLWSGGLRNLPIVAAGLV